MAQIKHACPLGILCESCGGQLDLRTRLVQWRGVGVACLTLCPGCAAAQFPPSMTVRTRDRLIAEHNTHTGGAA